MTRLAAVVLLVGALVVSGCKDRESGITATGTAFGTEIAITISGIPEARTKELFPEIFDEVKRLEAIFTLLDPSSPLRKLNDTGELKNPPGELLEVLEICGRVYELTKGAFDPTIQPLWELYERHFAENPLDREGPAPADIAAVRERMGWDKIEFEASAVRYTVPGMAMTLNAVAPGYAADRVAEMLKADGVENAFVDVGENRALGTQTDGSPWQVGIRGVEESKIVDEIDLDGNALAISAGYATAFDLEQRFHHLFNPKGSDFQPARRIIAVIAPEAALADALSTAGGVMDIEDFRKVVKSIPGVRVREYR